MLEGWVERDLVLLQTLLTNRLAVVCHALLIVSITKKDGVARCCCSMLRPSTLFVFVANTYMYMYIFLEAQVVS